MITFLLALAVWLFVSPVAGLLVGRVVQYRDREVSE